MPDARATKWVEALPIIIAGAAAVLNTPSLGLSSTFGLVGVASAVYTLAHGARRWVVVLGIVLNMPLAVVAVLIMLPG